MAESAEGPPNADPPHLPNGRGPLVEQTRRTLGPVGVLVGVGPDAPTVSVRPAPTLHAAATALAQAHPERFVLGFGVGTPEQATAVGREFGSPTATAQAYLEATSAGAYPRLLAANGPRMLDLAARSADGALPAGRPPAATAAARATLGADKLLVVFVPLSEADPATRVADIVQQHRAAGADHVIVGRRYDTDFVEAVDHLRALAPAFGLG